MSYDIIFSKNAGINLRDTAAVFFRGPYENICSHIGKVAAEFAHGELKEIAKYGVIDGYLDITRLDGFGLSLIKKAVDDLLTTPSLIDWQKRIESESLFEQECQQQGKTRDEMLSIIRIATDDQLKHLTEKIGQMIVRGGVGVLPNI